MHGPALQGDLAAASGVAWCFLSGLVGVAEQVVRQVPPLLLVRLLHHLNLDSSVPPGVDLPHATAGSSSSASQPMSQVSSSS